jgi:methionine-rich copper-binding protein CopC
MELFGNSRLNLLKMAETKMSYRFTQLSVTLLLSLWALLIPSVTLGHARYVRSEPPFGALLKESPQNITIWFTQELASTGNQIKVMDQMGRRVDKDDTKVSFADPKSMSVSIGLNPLTPGVHLVEWNSVSAEDKDVLEGSFTFSVAGSEPGAKDRGNIVLPVVSLALSILALVLSGLTLSLHFVRKKP